MLSFFKRITFFALIINAQLLFSQVDTSKILHIHDSWINSQNPTSNNELHRIIGSVTGKEVSMLLIRAKAFQNDSVFSVKWNNLLLVSVLSKRLTELNSKNQITSFFLSSLFDPDPRIRFFAFENLKNIADYEFTQSQKDTVIILLENEVSNQISSDLYKLSAEQNITKAKSYLNEAVSSLSTPFYQKWVALASLVRMGNSEAEETMYYYLSRMGLSLDVINNLYPLVVFSGSKQNVSFLIDAIKNDNSGCESMNPNYTESIPCAYYVLKIIAPHIDAIKWYPPGGLEELGYNEALEKARIIFNKSDFSWNFNVESHHRE